MRSKLIYVLVMAVMSALLVITNSAELETTWRWTTPGTSVKNLNGKMFTLSQNRGGISFYPPYYSATPTSPYYTPQRTTRPYYPKPAPTPKPTTYRFSPKPTTKPPLPPRTATKPPPPPKTTTTPTPPPRPTTKPTPPPKPTTKPTLPPRTTTRRYYPTTYPYPWTTAPPTSGLTVCLRYLADYSYSTSLLKISPSSRNPLELDISNAGYQLNFQYGYNSLYLRPNIRFWSNPGADMWTRVCLTLDSKKNVAQVFSGSYMSIRKLMPVKYAWSGQPVIEIPGFDGQMTDLQVWDYPLRYSEVFNYMTGGVYMPYSGSVMTWSYISYTPRGSILLEDVYERQARQPISSSSKEGGEKKRKGYRPKGETKTMKLYYMQSKSKNNI